MTACNADCLVWDAPIYDLGVLGGLIALTALFTGVAMLSVLLARLAAIRWHLALPRFHLLNRD